VLVATDSEIIYNEIMQHNGHAVMSKRAHESEAIVLPKQLKILIVM